MSIQTPTKWSNKAPNQPKSYIWYPHLSIHRHIIIQQLQATLCNTTIDPTYFDYLKEEFQWDGQPTNSIQWLIIQWTLQKLKHAERQTITKFIHKWLPLQDQHHVHSALTKQLCPSCKTTKETAQHFLSCPHPDQWTAWKEMHQLLLEQFIHNTNAKLHDLLTFGLYTGRGKSTQIRLALDTATIYRPTPT